MSLPAGYHLLPVGPGLMWGQERQVFEHGPYKPEAVYTAREGYLTYLKWWWMKLETKGEAVDAEPRVKVRSDEGHDILSTAVGWKIEVEKDIHFTLVPGPPQAGVLGDTKGEYVHSMAAGPEFPLMPGQELAVENNPVAGKVEIKFSRIMVYEVALEPPPIWLQAQGLVVPEA